MNPGVTRRCDVSKDYPSMQPFFEYFIHLEKKVHLIKGPAHEVFIL